MGIPFPFRITDSIFKNSIDMQDTHLVSQDLSDSHVPDLVLRGAQIDRSLYLSDGFESDSGVDLIATRIAGDLFCNGGKFVGRGDQLALNADHADIKGAVYMNEGFTAQGGVNLTSATIGSYLVCTGGKFIGVGDQPALSLNGSDIKGSAFLDEGFTAQGEVNLVGSGVGDYWLPNAHSGAALRLGRFALFKTGSLLRYYFWFHIIAGWVLTTLWAGGFTGLIKS